MEELCDSMAFTFYISVQDLKALEQFHSIVLVQICYYAYYQDLEEGITRESSTTMTSINLQLVTIEYLSCSRKPFVTKSRLLLELFSIHD